MSLGLVILGLGVFGGFASRGVGMPRINPLSLGLSLWALSGILLIVFSDYQPQVSDASILVVLAGLSGFILGSLLGWVMGGIRRPARAYLGYDTLDMDKVRRLHTWLTALLMANSALMVFQLLPVISALGGINAILSGQGAEFRGASAMSRFQDVSQFGAGSGLIGLVNYVTFLGTLSFVTAAILWRHGSRVRAVVPLLVSALYSLVTLQRTSFVIFLLCFLLAVIVVRRSGEGEAGSSWKFRPAHAILAATLVAAILIPLQVRNQGTHNASGLTSVAQYLVSGPLGLNARTTYNPDWSAPQDPMTGASGSVPGYGAYTFSGLFSLLSRFGFDVPYATPVYEYYGVEFNGLLYYSNIGTAFLDFRYDFGALGPFSAMIVTGFTCLFLYRRVQFGGLRHIALISLLGAAMTWSFFGNSVYGDLRYGIVAVAGSLLIPAVRSKASRDRSL